MRDPHTVQIQTLYNHGFRQASDLAYADEALLANIPGIEADQIARIKTSALQVAAAEKKAVPTVKTGRTDAKAMATETGGA